MERLGGMESVRSEYADACVGRMARRPSEELVCQPNQIRPNESQIGSVFRPDSFGRMLQLKVLLKT